MFSARPYGINRDDGLYFVWQNISFTALQGITQEKKD
jgi:hypothetical protein